MAHSVAPAVAVVFQALLPKATRSVEIVPKLVSPLSASSSIQGVNLSWPVLAGPPLLDELELLPPLELLDDELELLDELEELDLPPLLDELELLDDELELLEEELGLPPLLLDELDELLEELELLDELEELDLPPLLDELELPLELLEDELDELLELDPPETGAVAVLTWIVAASEALPWASRACTAIV